MQYSDILEQLPEQLRLPVHKLLDRLREELLDSVKRSDFERLEATVAELAEEVRNLAQAQARTEARLGQLAERVDQLAQAQAKTEATVRELVRGQIRVEKELISLKRDIRREPGGISHTIGFTVENQSYPRLPAVLRKDFGVEISRLYPRFLVYPDGRQDQINMYGEGTKGGKPVYALGEAKAQLGKRDIDSFFQVVRRAVKILTAPAVSFMVTYFAEPAVEEYAQQKGLKVYWFHALPEPESTKRGPTNLQSRKTRSASGASP